MCGGPDIPEQASPEEEAKARIMEAEAAAKREAEAAAKKKADEEAQRMRDIEATKTRTASAYNNALKYGQNKLSGLGIEDKFGIMDLYRSELDAAKSKVPEVSSDPSSFFSNDLYDTAYGAARNKYRTGLQNEFGTAFGDTYSRDTVADSMDDMIIKSILDEQKTGAMSALETALARGKINDTGYQAGLSELEKMYKMGDATAQGLGGGVLSGYRKQLDDRIGNYKTKLSSIDFTDKFSLDSAKGDISGLAGGFGKSLEGDILKAIGDTSFFDTGKLIGKAGERGGVFNPSAMASGTSGAGLTPEDQKKKQTGTLTNSGAF